MQINISAPNPKQELFFRAKSRFVGYGGARGGGKSWAARNKAVLMALRYPGIRVLIMRRTLPEIRSNHIIPILAMLAGAGNYSDLYKEFRLNNGSSIFFGYCDNDRDVLRYQGLEFDVCFIDEATQFKWEWFQRLSASMRGINDFPKRMYLTCNPGGVGHAWVRRLFIDKQYEEGEDPSEYEFIQANVYDNEILMREDPGYLKFLKSLYPTLRRAWLEGDWDAFTGRYFKDFDISIHVVQPFELRGYWRKYIAFDYGLDMLAAYGAAFDSSRECVVYQEVFEPNLIISNAAERIKGIDGWEKGSTVYAPPDMWNRQSDRGLSAAELFAENGVHITKAKNDRVQGWMNLSEWLKPYKNEFGEDSAKLRIFSTCENLIRSLRTIEADEKNPSDVAVEPHELTHAPDALRYLLAGRPCRGGLTVVRNDGGMGDFLSYGT